MTWNSYKKSLRDTEAQQKKGGKREKPIKGHKNSLNGWAIPRSERYLALRLAKKKPEKTLGGLYEALATGSTVI